MGNYDHSYTWGNNEKRLTLKGRRCAIVARGKKNSIMVEFEDGQREIVSRYSVKRLPCSGVDRKEKANA